MGADLVAASCGAGVQSTTILLLALDGHLPKPDVAIFADTGWEPAAVYDQVDRLEALCHTAGIAFHRVSNGNLRRDAVDPEHRYASIPYYVSGPCQLCDATGTVEQLVLSPAAQFAAKELEQIRRWLRVAEDTPVDAWPPYSGTCPRCKGTTTQRGIGRRQCTSEYKLAPITRKVRELLGAKPPSFRRVPKGRVAEQWVGFSTDEVARANRRKDSQGVSYLTTRYPLLDLELSRADCEKYLAEKGWGHTVKSSCIGCPFHGNAQWRELRDTCASCGHHRDDHWRVIPGGTTAADPTVILDTEHLSCAHNDSPNAGDEPSDLCRCPRFDDSEWADAVAFDAAIRKGGSRGLPLTGEAFLHASRVPLDQAPLERLTRAEKAALQPSLLDLLENGPTDGCSPYGCRSDGAA